MIEAINKTSKITVLGIGNTLYSDEGIGVHILMELRNKLDGFEHVEIVEGATDGMRLLGDIEDTDYLLIIDAINAGKPPGTIYRMEGEDIPKYIGVKMSIHQIGFQEVLSVAKVRERLPRKMVMYGIQPYSLELNVGLSPTVEAKIPELAEKIKQQIIEWS